MGKKLSGAVVSIERGKQETNVHQTPDRTSGKVSRLAAAMSFIAEPLRLCDFAWLLCVCFNESLLNLSGLVLAEEFGGSHSGVIFEDAIERSLAVESRLQSNREQRMIPICMIQ